MGIRTIIFEKIKRSKLSQEELEAERIAELPSLTPGYAHVFFDKPFKFNDGGGFLATYNELFTNELYKFKPDLKRNVILDCGANIGLSVLFFSINYPNHRIIAFEPDPIIFEILSENVATFNLKNVELLNKAVWDRVAELEFFTDNSLGGRINVAYEGQVPRKVETVRLHDFLNAEVDFLKLDIEGAEDTVLRDCKDKLGQLNSFFFEYHNDVNKPQTLHQLLEIVSDLGFHYYVKESGVRRSPFTDTGLICESFDMAINIFCYR